MVRVIDWTSRLIRRAEADPMTTEHTAHPKILILTLSHGAAHRRASSALRQALLAAEPGARVEVIDALEHCTRWFRAYYNSYEIPLRVWPSLWGWIESIQHQSQSTGPGWLYRRGAQPLFRFIQAFDPDIVVATEVGVCELASMLKRRTAARFRLVGVELMDFNQAWVQPEVDLYLCTHEDLGAELAAAGAPREKILCSGQPLDPAFASLPPRQPTRARLGVEPGVPLLLVLFGGTGFGKPRLLVNELRKVRLAQQAWQAVFITGRNPRLEAEVRKLSAGLPRARVLGWVDNIQEWMVAADLMISKPGGATLTEGFACGLPMLAFDPLPGNEQRTCRWIEKWKAGRWIRKAADLAPTVERLLANREELDRLRQRALALARPRAAYDGAAAILKLWRASVL
ncbi:MAG TPA: glycosyltransferase [Terriglobia bacterium]|nr:glycosyltransferase [Terriglobia bacterium]